MPVSSRSQVKVSAKTTVKRSAKSASTVPSPTAPATYPALLKVVRAEIAQTRDIIERRLTVSYWNIGRYISRYVLEGRDRARYGAGIYKKLSEDLKTSADSLERMVRFARDYPISAPARKLLWSHYRELLAVKDLRQRAELMKEAESRGLNTKQLRREIAQYKARLKGDMDPKDARPLNTQLPLQRGRLYTYQIIFPKPRPVAGVPYVDLGFDVWKKADDLQTGEMDPKGARPLSEGALVATQKKNEAYALVPAGEGVTAEQIYTYKAWLEKIIDGDTIWLNVDLGFNNVTRQKVRFNGIDTPEINTPAGQKAKRFVERALSGLVFFVIKTHKTDKYDRYLTDIFYLSGEADPQAVADNGRYLNQELLDAGLAEQF